MPSEARLQESEDDEEIDRLESRSDALKCILVTCVGYQGYENSKFGRIEAHEAINAYAREIMLTAEADFQRHGWRVIHYIVDSIWVEAVKGEVQTDLETVALEISETVNIRLEYEATYEWICFFPRRDSDTGALTKQFGKKRGEDAYKVRSVEIR